MFDGLLQILTALNDVFAARDAVAALIIGATGLVMGGIMSAVVFRLPKVLLGDWETPGEPAARRAFCPLCGHAIAWRHNIPILSYLLLRGSCATCGGHISLRYPLVEAFACGVSLVALFQLGGDTAMVAAMVNAEKVWPEGKEGS